MTKPQTLQQAIVYFANKDVAHQYLVDLRWPDGVVCPHCKGLEHSYTTTRKIWRCKSCKKQFSVKVGTVFEDSPIGLDKWLSAVWMIANAKNGISSLEIHRALGVTQKTAWFILHRIRAAMQSGSLEKFSGEVEVDETYVGGKVKNMHKIKVEQREKQGRGSVNKSIVVGLLERNGQVKTRVVKRATKRALQNFVRENVVNGANVYSDEFTAYQGLNPEYVHQVIEHAIQYVNGNIHTNGIEKFWSLFKRTLRGTYVNCDPSHLFRYLDEQSFRFNNRKTNDANRFATVLEMVAGKRLTYAKLIQSQDYKQLRLWKRV